ncbi:MAG: dephospho-CoA kinase [Chlamydiia bacterium]|nr:dephospho-CoA kinase [Chlamydiia bacterium]
MLKLRKIAITGGVASGKTTVCRIFRNLGAFVVNADAIVHELLVPDTNLGQQIVRLFGKEIVADGILNRGMIAEKAFTHPQTLQELESLLHPAVKQRIEALYETACRAKTYTSFLVEIPLLFEIQWESFYDCVIAVVSDEGVARERFAQEGFPPEEYDRRMKRQLDPNQKAKRADYVILNKGSLEDLKRQVIALNRSLSI